MFYMVVLLYMYLFSDSPPYIWLKFLNVVAPCLCLLVPSLALIAAGGELQ